MAEELEREEILQNEDAILRGLLEAANNKEVQTATLEIARGGKVLFRFRVRPLTEAEYNHCRDMTTKPIRRNGLVVSEETNHTRFRSMLIHTATVDEDRKVIWDNKEAWNRLNVASGVDLIDVVLLAGEKAAVLERIEQLSGFGVDLEQVAKK